MRTISIQNIDITALDTDVVIVAAEEQENNRGQARAQTSLHAGPDPFSVTASEVPFPRKIVIRAVLPKGYGQESEKLTYETYTQFLKYAEEHGCRSIGFPLISLENHLPLLPDFPFYIAVHACEDFLDTHPDAQLDIIFAAPEEELFRVERSQITQTVDPCYWALDDVQKAIEILNNELDKIEADHDMGLGFFFDEKDPPDEADITDRSNDETEEKIKESVENGVYCFGYLGPRYNASVPQLLTDTIMRTLNHYSAEIVVLSEEAWMNYAEKERKLMEIPNCLVRVSGSAEHWYIFWYYWTD